MAGPSSSLSRPFRARYRLIPRAARSAVPDSRYPAMKPIACRLPYFPKANRSMPLATYSRQSLASLPATRLHSMIACGSWSFRASKMAGTYIGMSVRPSGLRVSRVERVSVPGATSILGPRPPARGSTASRIPSRRHSLSSTSRIPARTPGCTRALFQPPSIVRRIVATRSCPISRVSAARRSLEPASTVTRRLRRNSWSERNAHHPDRSHQARSGVRQA